ncbi:f-box domain-containing protein [Gigaspora margarita]|uniref:F-box domain-containing protein n=1 Tax=Gigaspora margarita TaxID=4874 RepID=A0A8H4AEP3_GIGMA|nr:f-box domain-containing protein [Gigaspora margarita]
MIKLPNECLFKIFINLKGYHKSLFSCLLVDRQWCKNVVPILWSEVPFKNRKFIRTCLLLLNLEEQTKLIPFDIILPNNSKPLFEYTNYIKSIKITTDCGILGWLNHEGSGPRDLIDYSKEDSDSINAVQTIRSSLTLMFLKSCNKLNYLSFRGINYNEMKILFENIFNKNSLNSLDIGNNQLGIEERIGLVQK